jgi:hypothetical protein
MAKWWDFGNGLAWRVGGGATAVAEVKTVETRFDSASCRSYPTSQQSPSFVNETNKMEL